MVSENTKAEKNNKNIEENEVVMEHDVSAETSDDVTDIDLDDSVVAEESLQETVKKLREKLKKATSEKQEYLTGWQKDKAEFLNARKRDKESNEQFVKFSTENLVAELVPVLDSFNMAMGNKEAWDKVEKNWRVGVEYIFTQLRKTLEENGLKEIDPIEQMFDATRDEAISHEPVSDESLDHKVVAVIQKGYTLNGKVLKAPKVKVGEFKR